MDYTGSSYKGDMKNDKMEGEGEYTFPSSFLLYVEADISTAVLFRCGSVSWPVIDAQAQQQCQLSYLWVQ